MSVTNTAIYYDLAMSGYFCTDGVFAQGSTQGTAVRVASEWTRVIGGAANSGLVLPSILSGEAFQSIWFVMNDGANAILVYPSAGEKHNGSSNATLSVPAGQTGVFFPVPNHHGGTFDWRSAVLA